ncbi:signal transduction histidine kinase [Actinoplanes italicus]|uniref:histidine kinase n=2 Tax=Actinoplanes italicus TaxID=113567 RepID=A0A2T0JXB3_9ACTN|nr:signal transduction histidine kinase [Actinoplanes italicus]
MARFGTYRRRMISDGLRAIRPTDVALAGGFAAFGLLEEYFIRMPGGWWPYVLAGVCALILVRRSIPLLAMLPHVVAPIDMFYVQATIAGEKTVNFRLWQMVAMMIAAYTVGRCVPPTSRCRRTVLGIALILLTTGMYLWFDDGDPMAALFFPLAPYGLGVAVAVQARRTDEAASARAAIREQQAREAVMEERVRIARELHDMVAHSVTVMVIQAGVVRRRLDAGLSVDRELLHSIEASGREAVGELRRTLGLLRGEDADSAQPPAGLDRLDELIAQVREAGLTVTMRRRGAPVPLPPAVDLSAYRIVQEALTNVLKHAGPVRVTVTVGYQTDGLYLSVLDDGGAVVVNVGGQGLIGMRERAALFGGELRVGPRATGGFAVEARLPMPAAVAR